MDFNFFRNKKILVTGHSGFKGSWLCRILANLNAEVYGYSLEPVTENSLFHIINIPEYVNSQFGDIRDFDNLLNTFQKIEPEIVIHLAAQPLVRESYRNPRCTYDTNVMGTVNILECIRQTACTKSFLNVTTDKVYENKEWVWGYRENEPLDGFDPYSNSKSCSELVTHSFKNSFFRNGEVAISTARAGNVIGGGDFSSDRIIPDCVRAAENGGNILVRNPNSIRPYQHVLEPLFAYLQIVNMQYNDQKYADYYNVGPDEEACISTSALTDIFCRVWGNMSWINGSSGEAFHEANFLKLDCSKMKATFGWKPKWNINTAVEKTVEWEKCRISSGDLCQLTDMQIKEFINIYQLA